VFQSDSDIADEFMDRFELDSEQFKTVASFFSIISHEPEIIIKRPDSLKSTRAELEDHRSRALDMFLYVSKAVDKETIESNGGLDPTCFVDEKTGEPVIGSFSHERYTRAAIRVFDGMSLEEAGARAGIKPEAVECFHGILTRKMLYMAAVAAKTHPDWNALDVLKSFDNIEQFGTLNDAAFEYLEEDEQEAREHEEEAN